jgi:hypothetical protein
MIAASWRDWDMVFQITKNTIKVQQNRKCRTAAFGPACVKTQKRPHVIPFKLDWVSGEVGLCWIEIIGSEASQIPYSLRLILTSTIAFF